MTVAWFLSQYERADDPATGEIILRSPVRRFADQIVADAGYGHETPCGAGWSVWVIRASTTTLQAIAAATGVDRLPKDRLATSLADLTSVQKTALRQRLNAMGYTAAQIAAALGNDLGAVTLRDVLRFACRAYRTADGYDPATDTVIWNGPIMPGIPDELDVGEVEALAT